MAIWELDMNGHAVVQCFHLRHLQGCRICYWGDIGGNLVRELHRINGAKCIFYIGKLGSLRPEYIPNQTLAIGGQSFVSSRNEIVTWNNPLEPYLHYAPSP